MKDKKGCAHELRSLCDELTVLRDRSAGAALEALLIGDRKASDFHLRRASRRQGELSAARAAAGQLAFNVVTFDEDAVRLLLGVLEARASGRAADEGEAAFERALDGLDPHARDRRAHPYTANIRGMRQGEARVVTMVGKGGASTHGPLMAFGAGGGGNASGENARASGTGGQGSSTIIRGEWPCGFPAVPEVQIALPPDGEALIPSAKKLNFQDAMIGSTTTLGRERARILEMVGDVLLRESDLLPTNFGLAHTDVPGRGPETHVRALAEPGELVTVARLAAIFVGNAISFIIERHARFTEGRYVALDKPEAFFP